MWRWSERGCRDSGCSPKRTRRTCSWRHLPSCGARLTRDWTPPRSRRCISGTSPTISLSSSRTGARFSQTLWDWFPRRPRGPRGRVPQAVWRFVRPVLPSPRDSTTWCSLAVLRTCRSDRRPRSPRGWHWRPSPTNSMPDSIFLVSSAPLRMLSALLRTVTITDCSPLNV